MPTPKRLRWVTFNAATTLSVAVCASLVVMWVRSFRADTRLVTFAASGGARYSLKSSFGRLVLLAPPGDGASEDPAAHAIAGYMSNDDFDWRPSGVQGFFEGTVRAGTATAQMFEQFRARLGDPADLSSVERVWLAALDDPRRFLPAHLMLVLRGRGISAARVRAGAWPGWVENHFYDANAEGESPVLYVEADRTAGAPDLSRRAQLRDEWHGLLDETKWAMFDGWLVLGSLVLPLAWVARPRLRSRPAPVLHRWAFNTLALASLLLSVASAAMWVRSWWVDEQWVFAPRPISLPPGRLGYGPWRWQRWVGSSKGRLLLLEREAPDFTLRPMPYVGYERRPTDAFLQPLNVGRPLQGERRLVLPGVRYFAAPSQALRPTNAPAAPLVPGGAPVSIGWGVLYGYRSLALSWWVPTLFAVVLPTLWLWSEGIRRLRLRREARRHLCRACGYDLRATPDRCPECGTIPTSQPPHPLAPVLPT